MFCGLRKDGWYMNLDNIESRYAIYGMIFSLSNRMQTIGDKVFQDITMKQQFLMVGLEMFEKPPTLKEVGELIGCSYQNVKRMAEQLQKNGYLQIVQDERDRRKLLLVSTGKMDAENEKNQEKTVQFMNTLFRNLDEKDLEITLNTLKIMDKNIGGKIE